MNLAGISLARKLLCHFFALMTLQDFTIFFQSHYPALCARTNLLLRDSDLSEDLVQDAFVKFWEKKPVLLNAGSAHAYVSKIALNNALMHLREKKRQKRVLADFAESTPVANNPIEEESSLQESEKKIFAVLQRLPPSCREVFILSRYEQMSYKEIASGLDISVKTVENQILKALKILRQSLLTLLFYYFL